MAFRTSLRLARAARAVRPTVTVRSFSRTVVAASSLPNPDPAEDSRSAALVREHAPFMVATYSRPPPVFVRGEGSYLYDIDNRKYLDFTSGIAVNSLGHCDPEVTKLIAEQVLFPSSSS